MLEKGYAILENAVPSDMLLHAEDARGFFSLPTSEKKRYGEQAHSTLESGYRKLPQK